MDNCKPTTTIIILSGNQDFAYTMATLRARQYRVIVIAPTDANKTLTELASVLYAWEKDVMIPVLPVLPVLPPPDLLDLSARPAESTTLSISGKDISSNSQLRQKGEDPGLSSVLQLFHCD